LLHAPSLLLLDEPDTGLDEEGTALLEMLLLEHAEAGGTTLFTTHTLERALKLSDRIVLLSAGRIVYQKETMALELESVRRVYQEVLR
jgi:heme exporter protein A